MATAKQFGQQAINTLGTLYTAPASGAILKSFDICNTTALQIKVRVYIVPNGGSAATTNALMYDYVIPARERGLFGWEGEQVLANGVTIQVEASAQGLTITASGVEL